MNKSQIKTVRVAIDLPIIINPDVNDDALQDNIKNHLCVHFADDSDTQTAHDSFDLVNVNLNPQKKTFYVQHNIGRAKYVVSYHDGVKTHPDGSPFFDMIICANKRILSALVSDFTKLGYIER